jgi:hypothetical protein
MVCLKGSTIPGARVRSENVMSPKCQGESFFVRMNKHDGNTTIQYAPTILTRSTGDSSATRVIVLSQNIQGHKDEAKSKL